MIIFYLNIKKILKALHKIYNLKTNKLNFKYKINVNKKTLFGSSFIKGKRYILFKIFKTYYFKL